MTKKVDVACPHCGKEWLLAVEDDRGLAVLREHVCLADRGGCGRRFGYDVAWEPKLTFYDIIPIEEAAAATEEETGR